MDTDVTNIETEEVAETEVDIAEEDKVRFIEEVSQYIDSDTFSGSTEDYIMGYIDRVQEPELLILIKGIFEDDKLTTTKMYDKWAGLYDLAFPDRTHANRLISMLDSGVKVNKALDLGCGTGESTIPLLEVSDKVVAMDASSEMLNIAKDKLADRAVDFMQADFLQPPGESLKDFDLVLSVGVTRHIPLGEEDNFMRFIFDALKPGATALLSFVTRRGSSADCAIDIALEKWLFDRGINDRRFDNEFIGELISANGFTVKSTTSMESKYLYDKQLFELVKSETT